MPTIRVDSEVYRVLQGQAEPFVDTPNSVLRRVLQLRPSKGPDDGEAVSAAQTGAPRPTPTRAGVHSRRRKVKRERAPAGSLLPIERYKLSILNVLVERGGGAPAGEVIEAVGDKLSAELTPTDKESIASGGIRWHKRVQFARLHLVEEGAITKEAPRGVWTITDAGRRKVR
jgi:Mrr restriction endonuclease-like protein